MLNQAFTNKWAIKEEDNFGNLVLVKEQAQWNGS